MILYRLRCTNGHEFEGWFKNGETFDVQVERSLVCCPECADTGVEKALMTPAIGRGGNGRPQAGTGSGIADTARERSVVPELPDNVRAGLQRLRAVVEARCENVGERFAEEAMKRHRAEGTGEHVVPSGIYGTMTSDERSALEDKGIDFATLPWIDRADA